MCDATDFKRHLRLEEGQVNIGPIQDMSFPSQVRSSN